MDSVQSFTAAAAITERYSLLVLHCAEGNAPSVSKDFYTGA